MKYIIIIIVFFTNSVLMAQAIVLQQSTEKVLRDTDFGPNKKKYSHGFYSLSFPFSTGSDETKIAGVASLSVETARRFKYKLSNAFSIGYDYGFSYNQHFFKKDSSSLYTQRYGLVAADTIKTDKLTSFDVMAAPYFRINIGKRGDHLGTYIDFAGRAEFSMFNWHTVKYKHNGGDVKLTKVSQRGLNFYEKFQFSGEARFGHSFYNFFVRYRITNSLKPSESIEYQLPRFKVGFSIIFQS